MAKAFMTGSAGFIGRNFLATVAAKTSYSQIVCPVKTPDDMVKQFKDKKITFYKGNIAERSSVSSMIKGCDIVFHFAAKSLTKNRKILLQSNRDGTKNIIDEAVKSGTVKKIVYLSSIWAVDRPKNDDYKNPLTEKSDPNPHSLYGETKLEGERLVKESGIPYVILRLPPVYGPGSNPDYFVMRFIRGIEKRSYIYCFPFPGTVSLAYVEDGVEACLIAAENSSLDYKTFFFCTAAPVKVYNIANEIMSVLGVKKNGNALQVIIADALKMIACSWIGRKIVPVKAKTLFTDYLVCDSGEFERATGYKSKISLKEGMIETIDWYKKEMAN